MKINWKSVGKKVGDVIEWVPLPLGAMGLVLAYPKRDMYMLIMSLWLISFPMLERRLKLITEQSMLLVMVAHLHAMSLKSDLVTPPPQSQQE